MSGIYVHIPFCKKACHYCDFHFSTQTKNEDALIDAIVAEIDLRKSELHNQKIESIYFGGGTPSIIRLQNLEKILTKIFHYFDVSKTAEITMEANPDDCSLHNLIEWKNLKINRLSIGVQSFDEADLVWMNRSHNAQQALESIENAATIGFSDVNLDLIYGIPVSNVWQRNVELALSLPINHLSAYSLTIEKGTALHHFVKTGKEKAAPDSKSNAEYDFLQNKIKEKNWTHYEISNYCKSDNYALHNTSYWKQKPYWGFGPSAHSYTKNKRRWNLANNPLYIKKVNNQEVFFEEEQLTKVDSMNEQIMLGLRTKWGLNLHDFETYFGINLLKNREFEFQKLNENRLLEMKNNVLYLTDSGKKMADFVASELFFEND
ncbi:MAG: radical SAM family heme chaperone HemW [Flavobacteriales bacterium]|nr:radical SAM family heme chaperone HemW [Flavobacteriales bacterium]